MRVRDERNVGELDLVPFGKGRYRQAARDNRAGKSAGPETLAAAAASRRARGGSRLGDACEAVIQPTQPNLATLRPLEPVR